MPEQWDVIARRQELLVEAEVARRLVPIEELHRFVERMTGSELGGATAGDIADHFDVPEDVAKLAARQLAELGGNQ